jgi:hypothetical protein
LDDGLHQIPEQERGETAENAHEAADPDHPVKQRGGCGHDDVLALCMPQHTDAEADKAQPDQRPDTQPRARLQWRPPSCALVAGGRVGHADGSGDKEANPAGTECSDEEHDGTVEWRHSAMPPL